MSELPESADLLVTRVEEAVVASAARTAPGAQLKEARLKAGLGVEEVARVLKFSPRQITALEADDYGILQGATFVRGFIRSYARILKLDPQQLLDLLEEKAPQALPQVAVPENMGEASPKPFIERFQRPLLALLLLLVLAAVAAYLYTRDEQAETSTGEATQPVMPPAEAVAAPAGRSEAEKPQAPVAGLDNGAVPATAPPPVVLPSSAPIPAAATAVTPAVPVVPVTPVLAADEREMQLDFIARTWVEIKDSRNRIVLTGEYLAGVRQVVAGKPPFQLWIGKASGVKITYGDKRVDLAPYARDDVARMTLE